MLIEKKVFFASEVASMLGCSTYKVYELLHSGELKGFRDCEGGTWYIPAESIEEYIARRMEMHNKEPQKKQSKSSK